jgi:hypothetical protein
MQGEDPVLDHQMGTLKCNRKGGGERERERERERESTCMVKEPQREQLSLHKENQMETPE